VTEKRAPGQKRAAHEGRMTVRELPGKNESHPGSKQDTTQDRKKNPHFDISVSSSFHTSPTELAIFVRHCRTTSIAHTQLLKSE
jgi:hypothetical protein